MPKPSRSINTVKKMTSSEPRCGLSTISGREESGEADNWESGGRPPRSAVEFTNGPPRATAASPAWKRAASAVVSACRSPYDSLHASHQFSSAGVWSRCRPATWPNISAAASTGAAQSHLAPQPVLCRQAGRPARFRSPGRRGWAAALARRDRPVALHLQGRIAAPERLGAVAAAPHLSARRLRALPSNLGHAAGRWRCSTRPRIGSGGSIAGNTCSTPPDWSPTIAADGVFVRAVHRFLDRVRSGPGPGLPGRADGRHDHAGPAGAGPDVASHGRLLRRPATPCTWPKSAAENRSTSPSWASAGWCWRASRGARFRHVRARIAQRGRPRFSIMAGPARSAPGAMAMRQPAACM